MIEALATHMFSLPITLPAGSATAPALVACPMRQVPAECQMCRRLPVMPVADVRRFPVP